MKRAFGSKRHAAFWSVLLAVGLFASLIASVVARDMVSAVQPKNMQAFASWLPENTIAACAIMAAFSILLGIAAYLLFSRTDSIDKVLSRITGPRFLRLSFDKRSILICAAIILIAWLPIIAITYPTGMTVDTYNQIYQFQSTAPTYYPTMRTLVDAEFIDHHPVVDTLIYGAFWKLGYLAGSQDMGLFCLALLQSIVLAIELSALVCYLERLSVPWVLRLASLIFFAWFPFFGHYATTVLKDVTYLTFFIPWMLIWIEAARTNGACFARTSLLVAFMLLGGMCIVTKKLGLYLWLPCLLILFLFLRGQRTKLAVGGIATLLAFCVALPAVLYPAIGGVAPGGKQEMYGPVIQHLTALAIEDEDAFTNDELKDINKVFNLKKAKSSYEPFRSDGAKRTYKAGCTNDDVMRMVQIWVAKGFEHPATYLESTTQTCGMLFIPFLKLSYYYAEDYSRQDAIYRSRNPEFAAVDISQPDELAELNERLASDSIECAISDLPVISLFFTQGFYGGWIPFIAFICILFSRKRLRGTQGVVATRFLILGLVPVLLTIAYYPINPVASPRYILHLMCLAPLLLGWAWLALSQKEVQR